MKLSYCYDTHWLMVTILGYTGPQFSPIKLPLTWDLVQGDLCLCHDMPHCCAGCWLLLQYIKYRGRNKGVPDSFECKTTTVLRVISVIGTQSSRGHHHGHLLLLAYILAFQEAHHPSSMLVLPHRLNLVVLQYPYPLCRFQLHHHLSHQHLTLWLSVLSHLTPL